jgi:hypothetical protein
LPTCVLEARSPQPLASQPASRACGLAPWETEVAGAATGVHAANEDTTSHTNSLPITLLPSPQRAVRYYETASIRHGATPKVKRL